MLLLAPTYGVDGEGRTYSATAGSGQDPLTSTIYNVASQPTTVNLGSSDGDSFTYDPNTNLMTQYSLSVNSQSVVGSLTWNPLGTLASLAITDPINSGDAQTCTYSHDDLSRIASANCGSVWSQTFSYDAFGNINKSGSISFVPTYSATTNQMTNIAGFTPTYDSNGNVTNDAGNSYAWDANGRPVTADSVGLTFDALGRMVEQNRGGTYTQIVYTPAQDKLALMNGSTLQKGFVPLPGGSMAVYNSSGLAYYRHSDWLGTSRLASTPSRTVYYDGATAPFGEPYAQSGTADVSFTGQNQDTASTLYDFPAREYGQVQGRWPSPDPAGMASVDPADPQTWNRYAYLRNGPLSSVDPLGLAPDGCFGDDEGGFGCCDQPDWFYCSSPPFPPAGSVGPAVYVSAPTGPILIEDLGLPPGSLQLPSDAAGILQGVFGLPSPGCEFGACGAGPSLFGPGNVGAPASSNLSPFLFLIFALAHSAGGASSNITIQNVNSQVIARENVLFSLCVTGGAKKAMLTGAATAYFDKEPSATKAGVEMLSQALDLQNDCLEEHPLAVLDPLYKGIAMPGDIGRRPRWASLFGF
jgi:RHS repeat-associated protein